MGRRPLFDRVRLVVGFASLPFIDYIVGWIVAPAFAALRGERFVIETYRTDLASIACTASVLVTIFGVIPVVSWLLTRGPISLRQLLLVGGILGQAPMALVLFIYGLAALRHGELIELLHAPIEPRPMVAALLTGTGFGVASAFAFWMVAVRGTSFERDSTLELVEVEQRPV